MEGSYSTDSTTTRPIRVFLADDDPDDSFLFELALHQHVPESEFYRFENGQSLLAALENAPTRPDVIFLDLNMPILNGAETYHHLQQYPDWSAIPIVLLTGSEDRQQLANVHQIAPDRWHQKPSSVPELVEIIGKHLPKIE
ncbi:response regulator [Spirosoma arcticum]